MAKRGNDWITRKHVTPTALRSFTTGACLMLALAYAARAAGDEPNLLANGGFELSGRSFRHGSRPA